MAEVIADFCWEHVGDMHALMENLAELLEEYIQRDGCKRVHIHIGIYIDEIYAREGNPF
jgi:hypothetical protein